MLTVCLCSVTLAQRQTGSITGKVVDEQGQPLPGVSVTLSGPSMLGTQTYVTTEEGHFRFPAVPPGRNYSLIVELSGFQTVNRQEIVVNVGKTSVLTIELKQSTLEEEITVVGAAPTVDIKSSKQSVTYTSEMMNNWVENFGVVRVGGDVDESPHCYRNLVEDVLPYYPHLKVEELLRPVLVVMAPPSRKPWERQK